MTNRNRITEDSPGPDNLQPGSKHLDVADRYPSGKDEALRGTSINRETDFDKAVAARNQFGGHNELTRWTLQALTSTHLDREPEQVSTPPAVGFRSIEDAKQAAMRQLGDRLEKLAKGGLSDTEDYGDTSAEFKGQKLNPRSPVERHGY
jgi:hypothetical protein